MKHMAAATLLLSAAGLSAHAADENVNLVLNPSFEFKYASSTYGKVPLYWSRYSGDAGSLDVSGPSMQGDFGVTLLDGSTNVSAGIWSDAIPVVPGRVYDARCWCRRGAGSSAPELYALFYDGNGTQLDNPSVTVGEVGNWAEGGETVTAPAGASHVRILLYSRNASVGTASFDCVSLTLAGQRISDGAFDGAVPGRLPAHWTVAYTHSGAVQDVQSDSGSKGLVLLIGSEPGGVRPGGRALRLHDASATGSCGAWREVPASPGVPYRFAASVRKADGSGGASIYLKFYNSSGVQIATHSTNTLSSRYVPLTLAQTAPAGTAYARALCYIASTGTGTAYFDDVSFTENYALRYAAPEQAGSGAGTNASTAAAYTSSAFWNNVHAAAASAPVKVALLPGSYTNYLSLSGKGNSTNHILIAGEKPFGMNFAGTTSLSEFLRVYNCRNLIFRHLHFSAAESQADLDAKDPELFDYQYVMRIGASGYATENIRCEGLTFTGMLMVRYGITGAHFAETRDITWDRCAWTRCGWDTYDHCIYNANDSSNLLVNACYFQDCNGAYVRFRNRSVGAVTGCTFLATGAQPSGNSGGRRNHTFIQLAAFNPAGEARDETIGAKFAFFNNAFTYENTSAVGDRNAFDIYVSGIMPVNHPGFHLVSPADGAVLANESAVAATRVMLVRQYFGIDLAADCAFAGNAFTGCWPQRFTLRDAPADTAQYWTSSGQNCELDNLVGLE